MPHERRKPENAQRTYGVLVGSVKDGKLKPSGSSPHYEIWISASNADFRVAVNVQSVDGSEVLVHYDPKFIDRSEHGIATLAEGGAGFTALPTGPSGKGLDYCRDELFPLVDMTPIPAAGAHVSLSNMLDGQIERAKVDARAVAVVFGEYFQDQGRDETFGFSPERGVHDIHFMQGNSGSFADDNRVRGDGGLFIRYGSGETIALFTRFSVQATKTDDQTGAPVG
ncbi:DUF2278 family protein (plasmid) [Rhizobium sp. CB3171]|uniref:DUF2278 family protein n=1 Tax=Rhizobium sp. CB3171 TaxID=3039157 RepID=UPI0024B063CB|nr:DUF2278 family protein [Rhizobium sp. CB3171]WFU04532.1 DUF2278 family protein [Rhizobium sp. CB3171]